VEGSGCGLTGVISWNLPGGTQLTQQTSQDIRFLGRDSNGATPEYGGEAFSLEPTCSVCVPEPAFVRNVTYVQMVVKCESIKLGPRLPYFFKYCLEFPCSYLFSIFFNYCAIIYFLNHRFPSTSSCSRESQITMYLPFYGL
jgi:hypothetical protein